MVHTTFCIVIDYADRMTCLNPSHSGIDTALHSAHFNLSGRRENFHFFFKRQCPFSQHYMSEFKVDEVTYNCCEQFMMQQKARESSFEVGT